MAREPRRGDPIPCVAEDAETAAEDVESDVAPPEIASAPDAESGVDALERAAAPDAESDVDALERAAVAESEVDELERTVELRSALSPRALALGRGLPAPSSARRPSASGAGSPWHCGCRGPSPLPEAWVV